MAVILNFRQAQKRRHQTPDRGARSVRTGKDSNTAAGEVVIFPGIRVDYGTVEVALSQETRTSRKQQPDHTGPSGRRSRKRRNA